MQGFADTVGWLNAWARWLQEGTNYGLHNLTLRFNAVCTRTPVKPRIERAYELFAVETGTDPHLIEAAIKDSPNTLNTMLYLHYRREGYWPEYLQLGLFSAGSFLAAQQLAQDPSLNILKFALNAYGAVGALFFMAFGVNHLGTGNPGHNIPGYEEFVEHLKAILAERYGKKDAAPAITEPASP